MFSAQEHQYILVIFHPTFQKKNTHYSMAHTLPSIDHMNRTSILWSTGQQVCTKEDIAIFSGRGSQDTRFGVWVFFSDGRRYGASLAAE